MRAVAEGLAQVPMVSVLETGPDRVYVQAEDAKVRIFQRTKDSVHQEAHEIASEFAQNRLDRAEIGATNCRFEVFYDPAEGAEFVTSLILITDALEALVGGWLFDPTEGVFLSPSQ